jgi:zinc/manganese transport system substrate-binding protein
VRVVVRRRSAIWSLAAVFALAAAACGSSSDDSSTAATTVPDDLPQVVVTYSVLGAVVSDLMADVADVVVLMPNGIDPHDYQPSAKDVEAVANADLVVANGLDLEEGLADAVESAEADGVPVFYATDHVDLRQFGEGEGEDDHAHEEGDDHADEEGDDHADEEGDDHADEEGDDHADEEGDDHGHGGDDPHFWVDPSSMKQVVSALGPEAAEVLGVDLVEATASLEAELDALDAATADTLSVIPADQRLLVTGHESMGYFARRYDFVLVGALIPSTTSQSAPSAAELAELREQIEELGVPAIFNEIGTPPALSQAIASETGVEVIELGTHNLPDDGSYFTFIDDLAQGVAQGLAPS